MEDKFAWPQKNDKGDFFFIGTIYMQTNKMIHDNKSLVY